MGNGQWAKQPRNTWRGGAASKTKGFRPKSELRSPKSEVPKEGRRKLTEENEGNEERTAGKNVRKKGKLFGIGVRNTRDFSILMRGIGAR